MLQASVHGKVRTIDHHEDIITSNVLGMFEFMSSPDILISILNESITISHKRLNLEISNPHVTFFFWTQLYESQPDVILYLQEPSNNALIFIEVKYLSGKSSVENLEIAEDKRTNEQKDQLKREFNDLYSDSCLRKLGIREDSSLQRYLIYLTADTVLPDEEIRKTENLINDCQHCHEKKVFWLSWNVFFEKLCGWAPNASADRKIRERLMQYLEHKGLKQFSGFNVSSVQRENYTYVSTMRRRR